MRKEHPMNHAIRSCLLVGSLLLSAIPALAATPSLPRDSLYQLPLQLTDQAGHRFDWRSLRGKPRVVSMFYTSCPFICPLIVDAGKTIERDLSPAEQQRIGIVLVSMDPANDTPAALQDVASKRKLDPARWTLAAPAPKDVRAVAGVLRIRYRQLADGSFNHSTALVLLDADGRELARTEQVGTVADPAFLAAVHQAAAH